MHRKYRESSISGELVRYCTLPLRSGGAGYHLKHVLIDDGLADLSDGEWLRIVGTLYAYFMFEYLLPEARWRKVSASFRLGSRGSLYHVRCLVILRPTLASSSSNFLVGWSSWRIFDPRFGAPPEAGRRGQTVVAFRSMVSPRHVFFFFYSFFSWSELPNRSDHTGVGEQLPPSSLAGSPRRTEEDLEIGAYMTHFLKTQVIRQSYTSCALNTLLSRWAYAKMSDIRCRYVKRTLQICYSCAINTLAVRYTFMPAYDQRTWPMSNVLLA